MKNNTACQKHKKERFRSTLLILFVLTIQLACSKQPAISDGFTNCDNGKNPTPIERDFKLPGDLLFMRSDRSELLAFNGETHELISIFRIPGDGFYDLSPLSQDGRTVVISHQDSSELETLSITLLSNRGTAENKKLHLPAGKQNKTYLWFSVDWANSNYLQGILSEKGNTGAELWESWLLNPYQLEWKSLSNIMNNLDLAEETGFSISPDMSQVLYINEQYQLILYDLIHNKTLWEYSDYDGIFPRLTSPNLSDAVWSTNGEMLALPITRDKGRTPGILIFDKSGKIINSIYFGDYQFGFNWSKDGQLISFYENRSTSIDGIGKLRPVIRIIDMKDGLIRDLCSLNEQVEPSQGISNNRIVWSPDQQFLAYSSWGSSENMKDGIILQKLSDPQVRIIEVDTNTMILLGWSAYHWTSANSQP